MGPEAGSLAPTAVLLLTCFVTLGQSFLSGPALPICEMQHWTESFPVSSQWSSFYLRER